jgi:branched-chain amino acid aminotransferase
MFFFNYNGRLLANGTPVINADNRGLRYGDGLFETMKCLNGKIILNDEHFARLWKGMQLLQFELPKHFTPEKLQQEILNLAIKNNHLKAARIRLTILRGDGGLYDIINQQPNYIIQTWALLNDTENLNSNGLVMGIYKDVKKSCDILSNIKHNNYLPYVMAALKAKKEKWNDAVVLNTSGTVCDTTIANIFFSKENIIYTPALQDGCVAGVMRQHFIVQLKHAGLNCIEKSITIDELLDADEVFLTNSIYNLRWVQQIQEKKYINSIIQKIYTAVLPTIL